MKRFNRVNACTIQAWKNYIGYYHSKEDRAMWIHIYNLFAMERETLCKSQ